MRRVVGRIGTGTLGRLDTPWWLFATVLLFLILLAVLAWLSVVSQGALLSAVAAEEERKRPNLQTFFQRGMRSFWPLLGLNVLVRLAVGLAVLLIAALLLPAARIEDPRLVAGAIAAFILLIPAAYLAITVAFFAALGVVRFRESLGEAIRRAWLLVRRNWLVVVETSALVFLIDALVAVLIAIGGAILAIPFFLLFLLATLSKSVIIFWSLAVIFILLLSLFILAVASAAVTFHYAVWALLAERLRKGEATAKVLRLAKHLVAAFHPR
jgi:hypothetical protein